MIAENANSKEFVNSNYYEAEYAMLLKEIRAKTQSLNSFRNPEEKQEIESRREAIEKNKVQIIKDLNRTFVDSAWFGIGTEGRDRLMDVLEVVSLKYTGIGYVQGMNFLVAAFLFHWSPAVTLGLMSHLIENWQMCDIYSENLEGVHEHNKKLAELTAKHLPEFHSFLWEYEVKLEFYSTQWIIDLFSHTIPLQEYYLFFDSFLKQSWNFFYRLVLTVLEKWSESIMKMDDWVDILEGLKEEVAKTNWKLAIKDANYKFHKL